MSYVAAGYLVTFGVLASYATWVLRRRAVLGRSTSTAPASTGADRPT